MMGGEYGRDLGSIPTPILQKPNERRKRHGWQPTEKLKGKQKRRRLVWKQKRYSERQKRKRFGWQLAAEAEAK